MKISGKNQRKLKCMSWHGKCATAMCWLMFFIDNVEEVQKGSVPVVCVLHCEYRQFLLLSLPTFVTAPVSALLGCCSFYDCVACLIFSVSQRLGVRLFLTGIFKMFPLIDLGSSSSMTQDPPSGRLSYPDPVGESKKQLVTGWLDWNYVVWTGLMESEKMLPNGTISP